MRRRSLITGTSVEACYKTDCRFGLVGLTDQLYGDHGDDNDDNGDDNDDGDSNDEDDDDKCNCSANGGTA